MARRRFSTLTAAMLVALLVASGCTGEGGDEGGSATDRTDGPTVEPLWSTPLADGDDVDGLSHLVQTPQAWVTTDTVVFPDGETMRGVDVRSGAERWRVQPPEGTDQVCAYSERVNETDVGAVLFGKGFGSGEDSGVTCGTVAALDADSGDLLWQDDVSAEFDNGYSHEGDAVSVGEEVLTFVAFCGEVVRFDLQSGERLPTMLSADVQCTHEVAHNGQFVAVKNDPDGRIQELPERARELGWIPEYDSGVGLAVYDSESGEQLLRQEIGTYDDVHRIVSNDPLILDLTVDDNRILQVFDDAGEPTHQLGDGGFPETLSPRGDLVRLDEGVALIQHAGDPELHAYDVATGEELWARQWNEGGTPIGIRDGRVLAIGVEAGLPATVDPHLWAWDLRDATGRTDLGPFRSASDRIVGLFSVAWDEERMYLVHSQAEEIVAYPLPD
ncbi:PQQ-binding-like beta-propeller repeat protein [Streptomyces sp. B6B3]|uniref:outer membrane protein assembly factor BamB family protein n=1 Tax=Streptomyces sp. B6B3 TaxID=3153570 RepID=UPI00325F79DD